MQKIKYKKYFWTRTLAVLMEIVFIMSPFSSALAVVNTYDASNNIVNPYPAGTGYVNNLAIIVKFSDTDPAPFTYAAYTAPRVAVYDGDGNLVSSAVPATCDDTILNPKSAITSGTSPASGFCVGVIKCNDATDLSNIVDCSTNGTCAAVNTCEKAVATAYNNKIINALQAAVDAKISSANLDNNKANDALTSCGGDLACINKVLATLQNDSSFAKNSSTEGVPLTTSSLSDIINSNLNQSNDTGPINSVSNDQGGILGKQPGPKVDVTFTSSAGSQTGAKITANAVPSFFNNASDPKKLYFTWYLKRKNCGLTDSNEPGDVGACDMDGDGKITENDWKIAAAKIIVDKSFDRTGVDYSKFSTGMDEKASGYLATPQIDKQKDNDKTVDIGWRNGFMRDGNGDLYQNNEANGYVPNCYVQAPKSGRIYEIRDVKSIFDSNECPTGYHQSCVNNQTANCPVFNSLYDAVAAKASQDAIDAVNAWNNDPTNKNDSAYPKPLPAAYTVPQTITNAFGVCAISSEKNADATCTIKNDADLKNFKTTLACDDGKGSSLCIKDDYSNIEVKNNVSNILGVIVGTNPQDIAATNNTKMCSAVAKPNLDVAGLFLSNNDPLFNVTGSTCSDLRTDLISGIKNIDGSIVVAANASLEPKCTFEKDVNLCKHLFPNFPRSKVTVDGKEIDLSGAVPGDGKFSLAEKQFWGADPTKASTNGNGVDEQNVVGLGVDTFSWMFTPGDQVGVVVEGDSAFQSDHPNDASYQRMWAFSKGVCTALDNMEKDSTVNNANTNDNMRGFYLDGNKGILTANVDLNSCLKDNLLEPNAESGTNLNVQLNASPENPVNDPSGKGDILNISSTSLNSINSDGLLYKWSVQESRDGSTPPIDTTGWTDITTKMQNGGSFSADDINGLNKKDLAINLNMTEKLIKENLISENYKGVFYLRIKVSIVGTAADGGQSSEGLVVVRVRQQENEMLIYDAVANDSAVLSLNKGLTGQSLERCASLADKDICYVTKNEILGFEIPNADATLSNFSWKVNGVNASCGPNISSECTTGGNILFIPVLGNESEAVDVVATALKKVGNGTESIMVGRHMVISNGVLQINAVVENPNNICSQTCLNNNSVCQKFLGQYNNINGYKTPDCSNQVWETTEGKTVTFNVQGQSGFDWTIDGQIIPEYKDQNQLQLLIDKPAGSSYNIGVSTHILAGGRNQINNIRRALYKNWGIQPEDSIIEEDQTANIQLDVMSGSGGMAIAKPSIFGASLITHLPAQLMFLLKISLTSVLLLMATGLLFAFIPEAIFKEKK